MKSLSFLLQFFALLWLSVSWSFAGFILNPYAFPPPGGGGTDPYFANVILLLYCDGSNGGTTFTDHSSAARTLTASGNTNTSTTQYKYGTAAGRWDGSGDHLSCPHSTDFNFGTGDFTIEFWCRWVSKANFQAVYIMGSAGGSLRISTGDSNGLFTCTVGGGTDTTETGAQPSVDTWYHFAFSRASGVVKIFRDGVQRASNTNSGSISQTATIQIGSTGAGSVMNVYLDDVRVTAGVARYTADFTPPTTAHPDS